MHFIAEQVNLPVLSSLRLADMQIRYTDLLSIVDKHKGTLRELSFERMVTDRDHWKKLFNQMAAMRFTKLRTFRIQGLMEGDVGKYGMLNPSHKVDFRMPGAPWIRDATPLQLTTTVENAPEQFRAVATMATSWLFWEY